MLNQQRDDVVSALDALVGAVEQNTEDGQRLVGNLVRLRDACAEGTAVTQALSEEQPPRTMELLGAILTRLMETSGAARRALARGMRAEGESIPAIARAFGVTHQRISNILNHPPGSASVAPARPTRRANGPELDRN